MSITNKNQLVTVADLEAFKLEIITAIDQAIKRANGTPLKKWLKSSEARKLIGVSAGKLQTIRDSGMLSFTKIGGNIYYDQDEIVRLFEDNKRCK